jgi:hypothetical protein
MVRLIASLSLVLCSSAFAQARLSEARLAEKFVEPDDWANRANFYVGARGGVAVPADADSLAPMAGIEVGVSNSNGIGFGLHALWMYAAPGAPVFNVPKARYGFGALADFRYYFATIPPLTLYPTLSFGFVAGPSEATGRNAVLPLLNPGFGARVKFGNFYSAFEFGFAGFTIPFVVISLGYEGDRHRERAQEWARAERERLDAIQSETETVPDTGRPSRLLAPEPTTPN